MSGQSPESQPLLGEQSRDPLSAEPTLALPLPTSLAHRLLALVGATFLIFEFFFLLCYSGDFWFSLDLSWFGLPALLFSAALAFLVLTALESDTGCRIFKRLFKGAPPVVFRRWLTIDKSGVSFGLRHVQMSAIDEIYLTFWGNLQIRSRALCGHWQAVPPDVVLSAPFSAADQSRQLALIETLTSQKGALVVNERLQSLQKRLSRQNRHQQNHHNQKTAQYLVQNLTAVMMSVLLLDLAISSASYLEMLKHYYLAQVCAWQGQPDKARVHLQAADETRQHPFVISYVSRRFLHEGSPAAAVLETRADALWAMGNHAQAIADCRQASELNPDSYRIYLHLARLLSADKQYMQARICVLQAVEHHQDSLLPRLYLFALAKEERPVMVNTIYKQTMDHLNQKVFDDKPVWPPGGARFVSDIMYQNDVYFIFDRLLGINNASVVGGASAVKK